MLSLQYNNKIKNNDRKQNNDNKNNKNIFKEGSLILKTILNNRKGFTPPSAPLQEQQIPDILECNK